MAIINDKNLNNRSVFVIPHKPTAESKIYLKNLVDKIMEFHSNCSIQIYSSEDLKEVDYNYVRELLDIYQKHGNFTFNKLKSPTIISEINNIKNIDLYYMVDNKNYCDSAIWHSFLNNKSDKEVTHFYLLHDSMILNGNLDFMKEKDFYSYMYFDHKNIFDNQEQKEYCKRQILDNTTFEFKEEFTGLFGITFCASKSVLEKLYNKGLDQCLPNNKNQMCGSERIWGMVLEQIGIDIKENCLEGNFFNRKNNSILKKIFLNRS